MKSRSLIKRVFEFARAELERRATPLPPASRSEPAQPAPPAEAALEPVSGESAAAHVVQGLEVSRSDKAGLKLAWSLSPDDVARARALVDSEAVLCVRVVAFSALRDDVLREVQDRPGVELQGACDVGMVDGRAIVSIGLRAGERFASIVHHVL